MWQASMATGVFITAKWDIFDGFERVENLGKQRDEEKAAREEFESSRLAATRYVWTRYHDTLSAARRVDFAEGFVASAQENLNATEAAYKAGLSQISELTEAAGQLATARSARPVRLRTTRATSPLWDSPSARWRISARLLDDILERDHLSFREIAGGATAFGGGDEVEEFLSFGTPLRLTGFFQRRLDRHI